MSVTTLAMQFSSICLIPMDVVCSCVLLVSGLPFQYESTSRSAAIRTKVGAVVGSIGGCSDLGAPASFGGKATVSRAPSALALMCVLAPPNVNARGSLFVCSLLASGNVLDEVGFDAMGKKPALPAT